MSTLLNGLFLIFLTTLALKSFCLPIEVTGRNIKYYKLTPNIGSGAYNFTYGTNDGATRSERGFHKLSSKTNESLLVVIGSFKYPDSTEVFYIADEDGYRIVNREEIEEFNKIELQNNGGIPQDKNIIRETTTNPKFIESSKTINIPKRRPKLMRGSTIRPEVHIPVTESKLIKLNIVQPVKQESVTCAPGECSGNRQSKIIKIKPIIFG